MIINSIDWFQACFKPMYPELHQWSSFYEVKKMPYQTRHFKLVEEFFVEGRRICTAASQPHSEVMDQNLIMIKFDNYILYQSNLYQCVLDFIDKNNLVFNNISRLDVCLDFTRLYQSRNPQNFIKQFVSEKIVKVGKSKFACHGVSDEGVTLDYLKFGTNTSDVCYYMYNKSKELEEVSMKPHIMERWLLSGLQEGERVWRIEFSLKALNKEIIDTVSGECLALNDLRWLKVENYCLLYWALFDKYFKFVFNEGKSRKDRMKPVILFDEYDNTFIFQDTTKKLTSNRADKIFAKKLFTINDELRGNDKELSMQIKKVQQDFLNSRMLQDWAKKKGFNL